MPIINLSVHKNTNTCIISSDKSGLQILSDMIQMKIKMENCSHETLICKDYQEQEFKLRFELNK